MLIQMLIKMKRLVLPVVLFMNIVSAPAQMTLAPNVGMNISSYSNIKKENSFLGYYLGVEARYEFSNLWGIESGFFLSQKGANSMTGPLNIEEYPIDVELVTMDTKVTYLRLPLMFSIKHVLYKDLLLQISAGPYFSYGIVNKATLGRMNGSYAIGINSFEPILFETQAYGIKRFPGFNRWDIGASFKADLIMYNFKIGVLYDLGCSDVSSVFPVKNDKNISNRTFTIQIGYVFSMK